MKGLLDLALEHFQFFRRLFPSTWRGHLCLPRRDWSRRLCRGASARATSNPECQQGDTCR